MSINRIDYCQFLLSTQTNYTMTHFADHSKGFSHDAVNRLLRRDKLTGQIIWEHVRGDIIASPRGCLIFDDSVLDKNHSHNIELVRLQYSGNAHGLIKGIGMVNCLYVNPDIDLSFTAIGALTMYSIRCAAAVADGVSLPEPQTPANTRRFPRETCPSTPRASWP